MAKVWKRDFDLQKLNALGAGTMVEHVGIEFTNFGDDFLEAKMPVDHRTKQPVGLLHGGANVVLAETIGSVASNLCAVEGSYCVGVEISASHLKSAKSGWVFGKVTPFRLGQKLHVWNIEIRNEAGDLMCVSRLTCAVVTA